MLLSRCCICKEKEEQFLSLLYICNTTLSAWLLALAVASCLTNFYIPKMTCLIQRSQKVYLAIQRSQNQLIQQSKDSKIQCCSLLSNPKIPKQSSWQYKILKTCLLNNHNIPKLVVNNPTNTTQFCQQSNEQKTVYFLQLCKDHIISLVCNPKTTLQALFLTMEVE